MYIHVYRKKQTMTRTQSPTPRIVAALSSILMAGFHRLNIQAAYNEIGCQ